MKLSWVRTLYDYGAWADARVLACAERLSPEQFTAPGTAGHGSIRDTLAHALSAHRAWLSWLDGSLSVQEAMRRPFDPATLPDAAAVRERWEEVQRQTQRFLAHLTEDDLAEVRTETHPSAGTVSMPLWQFLIHVVLHGVQHRSEVAAMLTGFGQSPGNLDLLFFLLEHGATGGNGSKVRASTPARG